MSVPFGHDSFSLQNFTGWSIMASDRALKNTKSPNAVDVTIIPYGTCDNCCTLSGTVSKSHPTYSRVTVIPSSKKRCWYSSSMHASSSVHRKFAHKCDQYRTIMLPSQMIYHIERSRFQGREHTEGCTFPCYMDIDLQIKKPGHWSGFLQKLRKAWYSVKEKRVTMKPLSRNNSIHL